MILEPSGPTVGPTSQASGGPQNERDAPPRDASRSCKTGRWPARPTPGRGKRWRRVRFLSTPKSGETPAGASVECPTVVQDEPEARAGPVRGVRVVGRAAEDLDAAIERPLGTGRLPARPEGEGRGDALVVLGEDVLVEFAPPAAQAALPLGAEARLDAPAQVGHLAAGVDDRSVEGVVGAVTLDPDLHVLRHLVADADAAVPVAELVQRVLEVRPEDEAVALGEVEEVVERALARGDRRILLLVAHVEVAADGQVRQRLGLERDAGAQEAPLDVLGVAGAARDRRRRALAERQREAIGLLGVVAAKARGAAERHTLRRAQGGDDRPDVDAPRLLDLVDAAPRVLVAAHGQRRVVPVDAEVAQGRGHPAQAQPVARRLPAALDQLEDREWLEGVSAIELELAVLERLVPQAMVVLLLAEGEARPPAEGLVQHAPVGGDGDVAQADLVVLVGPELARQAGAELLEPGVDAEGELVRVARHRRQAEHRSVDALDLLGELPDRVLGDAVAVVHEQVERVARPVPEQADRRAAEVPLVDLVVLVLEDEPGTPEGDQPERRLAQALVELVAIEPGFEELGTGQSGSEKRGDEGDGDQRGDGSVHPGTPWTTRPEGRIGGTAPASSGREGRRSMHPGWGHRVEPGRARRRLGRGDRQTGRILGCPPPPCQQGDGA